MTTAIIYLSYRICTQRLVIKETGEVYDFHSEAVEFKKPIGKHAQHPQARRRFHVRPSLSCRRFHMASRIRPVRSLRGRNKISLNNRPVRKGGTQLTKGIKHVYSKIQRCRLCMRHIQPSRSRGKKNSGTRRRRNHF